MGDRVSIRFTNKEDIDAPVIFCHWGGIDFVEAVVRYSKDLLLSIENKRLEPLDRLEPRTVTCDFIYNVDKYYPVYGNIHRISHDLYMGLNENDGDNSDNGHFNIDLNSPESLDDLLEVINSRANADY